MYSHVAGFSLRRSTLAALLALGAAAGCTAYRRPPELTPQERDSLAAPPLPYAVTVAWWPAGRTSQNADAYASPLARLVEESGAFRSARYERSAAPAGDGLVATSTGAYCNSAVIPILTLVSLGIIPTVFDDEHCVGLELRRPSASPADSTVRIDVDYKGRVMLGWLAALVGALPGWGYGDVRDDERFKARFRLAVLRHRAEIARLASGRE